MTPRKQGGRPRAEEQGMSVHSWIPERVYDRLAQQALKEGRSVSSVVREKLSSDHHRLTE